MALLVSEYQFLSTLDNQLGVKLGVEEAGKLRSFNQHWVFVTPLFASLSYQNRVVLSLIVSLDLSFASFSLKMYARII